MLRVTLQTKKYSIGSDYGDNIKMSRFSRDVKPRASIEYIAKKTTTRRKGRLNIKGKRYMITSTENGKRC